MGSFLDKLFLQKGPTFARGTLALPQRPTVAVLGPVDSLSDDPGNDRTILDLTAVFGLPQQTVTSGDSSPHVVGTGIDLGADTATSLDAEVYATDMSGNWGWWRLTQLYRRVGFGTPTAQGSVIQPSGFPKGSNSGSPPTGWAADFAIGSGINAFTAFMKITGAAQWFWFIDGSRYPGDELALLVTIDGVFPGTGPTGGGTALPTFTSIVPSFGSTGGGP